MENTKEAPKLMTLDPDAKARHDGLYALGQQRHKSFADFLKYEGSEGWANLRKLAERLGKPLGVAEYREALDFDLTAATYPGATPADSDGVVAVPCFTCQVQANQGLLREGQSYLFIPRKVALFNREGGLVRNKRGEIVYVGSFVRILTEAEKGQERTWIVVAACGNPFDRSSHLHRLRNTGKRVEQTRWNSETRKNEPIPLLQDGKQVVKDGKPVFRTKPELLDAQTYAVAVEGVTRSQLRHDRNVSERRGLEQLRSGGFTIGSTLSPRDEDGDEGEGRPARARV